MHLTGSGMLFLVQNAVYDAGITILDDNISKELAPYNLKRHRFTLDGHFHKAVSCQKCAARGSRINTPISPRLRNCMQPFNANK